VGLHPLQDKVMQVVQLPLFTVLVEAAQVQSVLPVVVDILQEV
jgi:hypothetical protein